MRRRTKMEEDEEVEEILEAAEAMMLLRLTTDSHLASRGSDSLSSDLARRFNALKAPPSTNPGHQPPPRASTRPDAGTKAIPDEEMKRVLGDDLSARFAALKASSSSSAGESSGLDRRNREEEEEDSSDDGDVDEEGVSKKEVEKLMQWARDAARLDPSPPSDDEEDEDDGKQFDVKEYGTSDSDDELRRKNGNGKDSEKKKKKKKKLWF